MVRRSSLSRPLPSPLRAAHCTAGSPRWRSLRISDCSCCHSVILASLSIRLTSVSPLMRWLQEEIAQFSRKSTPSTDSGASSGLFVTASATPRTADEEFREGWRRVQVPLSVTTHSTHTHTHTNTPHHTTQHHTSVLTRLRRWRWWQCIRNWNCALRMTRLRCRAALRRAALCSARLLCRAVAWQACHKRRTVTRLTHPLWCAAEQPLRAWIRVTARRQLTHP